MASITTILGTHSLSSSRLTINNNFDNVNEELGLIANVLDTTNSTLLLTSSVGAGSFNINNGTLATFTVDGSTLTSGVEATFKENVIFEKGQQISIADTINFPTGTPALGAYELNSLAASVVLGASTPGQTLSIIAKLAFTIDASNGAIHGYDSTSTISVGQNGCINLIGESSNGGKWYIVSSHSATIS